MGKKQQKNNTEEQGDFKSKSFDILSEFTDSTSKVVMKAANILEEEVAAGVIAAKQVEEMFIDKKRISNDDKALINRFRKDAHELLDIFINVVDVSVKYGTDITDKVISMDFDKKKKSDRSNTPLLEMPGTVKPGGKVSAEMTVQNEGDKNIRKFEVYITELINANGDRIPSNAVKFHPVNLQLKTGEAKNINVEVNVPDKAKKGDYSALVQANSALNFKAVLLVKVV